MTDVHTDEDPQTDGETDGKVKVEKETAKPDKKARPDKKAKAAEEPVAKPGRRRGGDTIALVLCVTAMALLVGLSVAALRWNEDRGRDERRAAATQAARQVAVNMASLDYRKIKQGIDQVVGGMTGDLKDEWGTQARIISDTATKTQSISQVQQVRAGVVSMDDDSAQVIVAVNSITTSPKVKDGAPRYYRWEMDLVRADERWLVSKLGLVP